MGKFDGFLICSDVDGTFAIGKEIPPANREAVRYFVREGGLFTLSSGRTASYLRELPDVVFNAPLIVCNGARIVDDKTGETLWIRAMEEADRFCPSLALAGLAAKPTLLLLFHLEEERTIRYNDPADFSLEAEEGLTFLKMVACFETAADADAWTTYAREAFPAYQFVHSWPQGVEQLSRRAGKDLCVKWLKERLGVRTLVCVGDQENALSMLKEADVACCPANATKEVMAVSDMVVRDAAEGARAEVIERLEKRSADGRR